MTSASWTSSFLLTMSENLPQIGVVAVDASSVATTTHVYWSWVPCRSGMITGSAFDTMVEDKKATNMPISRPTRASMRWRWVIASGFLFSTDSAGAVTSASVFFMVLLAFREPDPGAGEAGRSNCLYSASSSAT